MQVKNELHYLNDKRISNDTLHNGRDYRETREFKIEKTYIFFHFITRLYIKHFVALINNTKPENFPDILFINSCLWDLTRWGPDGPKDFRTNILKTMKFLKAKLPPKTRVIWKTALPVSLNADGAIFVDEIKFIVPMLPWHILEANIYAGTCANFFNFDTLDFHHHMRLQGHLRVKDGIHWQPIALRYLTNLFLTHLCLVFGHTMPGNFKPSDRYLLETTRIIATEKVLENRINKKQGVFQKLFKKADDVKKTNGCMQGITNKVLTMSKNILKRKAKKNLKNKLRNVNSLNPNYFESNLNVIQNHTGHNCWNPFNNYASQNYNLTEAHRKYNNNYTNSEGNYTYQEQNYYSQYNFPS